MLNSFSCVLLSCATSLCMVLSPVNTFAQQAISITGSSGMNIGALTRLQTRTILYTDSDAAQYTITGDTNQLVRLLISVGTLTATDGVSVRPVDRVISPIVTNSDCAFSLDGGTTWTTFWSGTLFQDTRFPVGETATSSIYVRVGSSTLIPVCQQRGPYSGSITITAQYQ